MMLTDRAAIATCRGLIVAFGLPLTLVAQHSPLVQLRVGHLSEVTAVAFSPDGTLATGGHRGIVKLWDSASGLLLRTIESGATFDVEVLQFSPDGTMLASAARDEEQVDQIRTNASVFKIWDAQSGKELHAFRGAGVPNAERRGQRDVEFVDSGRALVVWGENGGTRIEVATGERRWEIAGLLHAASPSAGVMAVGSTDGAELALHEIGTGQAKVKLRGVGSTRNTALGELRACMPYDGSLIVVPTTTYRGATVSAFDTRNGEQRWTVTVSTADVANVACASAANVAAVFLASANSWRREALLLDAATGEERTRFVVGEVQLRDFSLSNDGRILAVVTADQQGGRTEIALWDTSSATRRQLTARDEPGTVGNSRARVSPDSTLAVVTGPEGEVRLFASSTGQERWSVGSALDPYLINLSADGSKLIAVDHGRLAVPWVSIWNAASGERVVTGRFKDVARIIPRADGGSLLLRDARGLQLWEIPERRARWQHATFSSDAVVSPDGSVVAVIDAFQLDTFRLHDGETGRERCRIRSNSAVAFSLTFSVDSALIAAPGNSGISVYDTRNCDRRQVIRESGGANWLTWSPDGAVLMAHSGRDALGADASTMYWDTRTWRLLRTERGYRPAVFSRDGKRMVRLNSEDNYEVIETTTGQVLATLRHPQLRRYQPLPVPSPSDPPAAAFSPDGTAVWTARQGELHRWATADGQLRATFAILDIPTDGTAGEWVAFTPDGYWHGSPGAERYLNWFIDGRATSAPDITERFHAPEHVLDALAGKP